MSRYLFAHEEDDLQHPGLRRNPEPESDYNSFRAGMQGHYTRVHWPVAQERMQKGWRIHSPLYGMVMRWGTDEQKQLVKDYVQQQPGGLFGGREKLGEGGNDVLEGGSETKTDEQLREAEAYNKTHPLWHIEHSGISQTAVENAKAEIKKLQEEAEAKAVSTNTGKTEEENNAAAQANNANFPEAKPLSVPPPPATLAEIINQKVVNYQVVQGDTLDSISAKSGVAVPEIIRLNKFIASRPGFTLFPFETIRLPEQLNNAPTTQNATLENTFPSATVTNTMAPVATENPADNVGYILNPDPEYYLTYGIYYQQIVPAIAVVTSSRKQAQEFADEMGYRFYYDVDPITRKRSILRQKDATGIYNREHYTFSVALVDEVNAVAQNPLLRQQAVAEGNLGTAFTLLVKAAQDVVFPNGYVNVGMYDTKTREEVKKYNASNLSIKNQGADNYSIDNLNQTIKNNATVSQQVAIVNIQGTEELLGLAIEYKARNWSPEMRRDYFYKVVKYRDVEPEWSIAEWKNFIRSHGSDSGKYKKPIIKSPSRTEFEQKNYDNDHKKHVEAWHFFNRDWQGTDSVYDPDKQLYLILLLESAKPYSAASRGRFTMYDDFANALDAYLYNIDDGSTTKQNVTDGNSPSFKGFYENYLFKATDSYLNTRRDEFTIQYNRYVTTDEKPKPELFTLMSELALLQAELDEISKLNLIKKSVSNGNNNRAGIETYSRSVAYEDAQIYKFKSIIFSKLANIALRHPILNSREFKTANEDQYDFVAVYVLIKSAVKKDTSYFLRRFKEIYNDRLESIAKLKKLLQDDPDKIWLFDQLVAATSSELGFVNGSVYQNLITGWQLKVKDKYAPSDILIFTNLIAGLLSAFFPPAALVLAPITLGTSGVMLAHSIEEYNFNNAASGTGYSNKDSLHEVPSLVWVILNSVALVFDGLTIVQALNSFRQVGQELSTLLFDKSGRLITDPAELVRIEKQAKQLLISQKMTEADAAMYAQKLTNREFLLRMEAEQAARDSFLHTRKDVPLMSLPQKFQALLADKMLGGIYTAGAYRLQDVVVGDTHLLAILANQFADSAPTVLARILNACGQHTRMAPALGLIHSGFTTGSATFNFNVFLRTHFSSPVADHAYFFLRLDAAGLTANDVAKASVQAAAGRTTLEAFDLFRAALFESAVVNEQRLLHFKPGKPATATGQVTGLHTQPRLTQAINTMNEQELQQFLKDLAANRRGMDSAEHTALKAQGEARLLSQIEERLLDSTGKIDPEKLRVLLANYEKQGVHVITGPEADVIRRQYDNANALYILNDTPGQPGTLVFSDTANRLQVIEELMHLELHRVEGFRKPVGGEIIDMEIDAHVQLLKYARGNGWSKEEIELLEGNLSSWKSDRKLYDTDAAFKERFDNRKLAFANKNLERDWEVLEERIRSTVELKKIHPDPYKAESNLKDMITALKNGGEDGIYVANIIASGKYNNVDGYYKLIKNLAAENHAVLSVKQSLTKLEDLVNSGESISNFRLEDSRSEYHDVDLGVRSESANFEYDTVIQFKTLNDSKVNSKKIAKASRQLRDPNSKYKIVEIICKFDTYSDIFNPKIIQTMKDMKVMYGIDEFRFTISDSQIYIFKTSEL